MNRHLVGLLTLLAVTGGAVALWTPERSSGPSLQFDHLPALVDGWMASEGAAEHVLPIDPRAIQNFRRTYTRDGHSVMLSVARYPSWNHPDNRPLFDLIAPTRGAGEVAFDTIRPGAAAPVNVIRLQRRNRSVTVAYWYQLDNEPITNEYGLRLRLFLNTLRSTPRAFALVRLAAEQPADLIEFLPELYPRITELRAS